MSNKITSVLLLFLLSWTIKAHQPNLSSTLLMEQSKNSWVLQIRGALSAFEYEIEQSFGSSSYATPKEFQELVLKYVEDHVSITINDAEDVSLKLGLVQLGHETAVSFKALGDFDSLKNLSIKNTCFSNIAKHKSTLVVLKEGFEKNQFILNDENQQTIVLKAAENKFKLIQQTKSGISSSYFWLFIIPVSLAILFAAKRIIRARHFRSKINEVKIWI